MVFEGRDAAGKGSTDQAGHASTSTRAWPGSSRCRRPPSASAASGTSSATSSTCPPPARSCCSTAAGTTGPGVERVMGYCTPEEYQRFLHQCPIFERMLVEDGIRLRKYWFSVSDAEQERALRVPARRPDAAVEAVPDGPRVDHPLGGLLAGQGRDDRAHRHPGGALVRRRERRQAALADQHDRPPALADPLRGGRGPACSRLPGAAGRPRGYVRPARSLQHEVPDHAASLEAARSGPQ